LAVECPPQFSERNGVFSPDGRWIAYVSDESGRPEVYVQAFPLTNEKIGFQSAAAPTPPGAKMARSCSTWLPIADHDELIGFG
jgi:hypothetical protein